MPSPRGNRKRIPNGRKPADPSIRPPSKEDRLSSWLPKPKFKSS